MITDRPKLTTKIAVYVMRIAIFTVRINSKSFPWPYAAYKERTSHIFSNVKCPILGKPRTPLQLRGFRHGRKAD